MIIFLSVRNCTSWIGGWLLRRSTFVIGWSLEHLLVGKLPHACHAHSVLFLPMHSLLKGFRLSHAFHAHSVLFLPMHSLLKGFRLMLAMRILFCSCLCKVCSRVSDALSQALCNLSLAFLVDFTVSDSTALIRFTTFSRKLHSAFRLDRKT